MDTIGYNNWRRYSLKLFESTLRIIFGQPCMWMNMWYDEMPAVTILLIYNMESRWNAIQVLRNPYTREKKSKQNKAKQQQQQNLSTISPRSLHPRHTPLVSHAKIYFVTILSRWVWRRLQRIVDSTWWRRHSCSCEDFKGVWLCPQFFFW